MIAAWLVFPMVLAALVLGCGMLVVQISGLRVPGALIAPLGLTAMIAAASLLTVAAATAELATPVIVGLAAAGAFLASRSGAPRTRRQLLRAAVPALVAAVCAFGAYAAPVVLSGEATFAGYVKLDDTATWLAQADRVMEHGRSLEGLAPSSYEATLDDYVGDGYPIGAVLPLGVGAALSGEDVAWVFQPYLAFLAAMLALALWALLKGVVKGPWLRGLGATIAAQPALLFGYSLWGGLKELTAAALLATLAAAVATALPAAGAQKGSSWRTWTCAALPASALLAVLSFGGLAWIGPVLALGAVAAAARSGKRAAARAGVAVGALTAVLALPSFAGVSVFVRPATAVLTSATELGNLNAPLSPLQILGVWLSPDFRSPPVDPGPTRVLLVVVALAALIGLALAARERAGSLVLYLLAAAGGAAGLVAVGSPWVDGKALATASPAFVLAAVATAGWLVERRHRVEGAVLMVVVSAGVLASNALAYREVWLAPRDSLVELQAIGVRIAGQGPTLMTMFEPFGVRHFLRAGDPEGASELRRRIVPLRDGSMLNKGEAGDIDRFRLPDLLTYRTLVLRRSPLASRPPSAYDLSWRGRHWEVWQQPQAPRPTILEHMALGTEQQPASTLPCSEIQRLARVAGDAGTLASAAQPQAIVIELDGQEHLATSVVIPTAGRWTAWLAGSFKPLAELRVNGRLVGSARHRLDHAGSIWPLGDVALTRGPVTLDLRLQESQWRPGSSGASLPTGPLVLGREGSDAVTYVPAPDWRELCDLPLDWVESTAPG